MSTAKTLLIAGTVGLVAAVLIIAGLVAVIDHYALTV